MANQSQTTPVHYLNNSYVAFDLEQTLERINYERFCLVVSKGAVEERVRPQSDEEDIFYGELTTTLTISKVKRPRSLRPKKLYS